MLRSVKQWQDGLLQPAGQLHSEQRKRHPWRGPPVRQQNHSPPVLHPSGQPPPFWQVLQGYCPLVTLSQTPAGEKQGLQGPPPQPTQPVTAPSETSVPVRKRPAPSEPAVRSLKNCRREERRASDRAVSRVRSMR
jgi:hypothetical protein